MGALFHRSKVTRRSQCSCFELESRRIHCCLLETFATVFLDSILAALDFTQDRLILPFLCHLFNKKNKTFNNITVQREKEPQGASRSAFSLIPTWYSDTIHHTLLMEPFFETIWALEGSHSTSWSRSFYAVCRTWRHLITHVGRALLFFVSHFFSSYAFHFRYKKLCLEDDDHLLLRRNEAEFNQKIDAH
jgi:hypothetical protein